MEPKRSGKKVCNITSVTISNLKNRKTDPQESTRNKIESILGTIDWRLTKEEAFIQENGNHKKRTDYKLQVNTRSGYIEGLPEPKDNDMLLPMGVEQRPGVKENSVQRNEKNSEPLQKANSRTRIRLIRITILVQGKMSRMIYNSC